MGLFSRKKKTEFELAKTKEYFENNRSFKKKDCMKCPDWMEPEYDENGEYLETPDELYLLYDPFTQRRFYTEGKVAAGALVQANTLLFEKGDESCPANYIYSTDPYYLEYPGDLLELARALFTTKGEQGYHPSIQRLADLLEDEMERIFAYKLPRNITEGRDVYFTIVMVDRDHLPNGLIEVPVSPMLVLENERPDAVLLPYWYWKA